MSGTTMETLSSARRICWRTVLRHSVPNRTTLTVYAIILAGSGARAWMRLHGW